MPQLPNYLRSNRKRLALSQKEVAFLLGLHSSAKVCRNERFTREPSLTTALAYEAIFQKPVSELFGGLYRRIEREVRARAKILSYRTGGQKPNPRTIQNRKSILNIAKRQFGQSTDQ